MQRFVMRCYGEMTMNDTQTFVGRMQDAQRMQNIAMSKLVDELPYIQAFNDFYSNYSFAWIPKWLQKKLEPMAYRCFKAGVDFQFRSTKDNDA